MTMQDEDRLRGLADLVPAREPRPLAEIRLRQRQLVRSRRVGRLAGGGSLLAVALLAAQVVFGGTGPFGGQVRILGTPATAGGVADCRGYAGMLERAQVPDELRYLLPGDAYGRPLTLAYGRSNWWNCPALLAQVVMVDLTADGSTARRALAVWGPDAKHGGEVVVPARVRGRAGEFVTDQERAGVLVLRWSEPDGSTWVVDASGLSRAEVIATADGLRITARRVVPASLPRGYDRTRIAPVSAPELITTWSARYGEDPNGPGDESPVTLVASRPGAFAEGQAPLAAPGTARFVDINGMPATYTTSPTGNNWLDWRTPEGVSLNLSGPLDLPHLAALARQARRVAPDDPLLAGVAGGN
jgi:hypothetical protein